MSEEGRENRDRKFYEGDVPSQSDWLRGAEGETVRPLKVGLINCINLLQQFSDNGFNAPHKAFFASFERALSYFQDDLYLLEALPNSVRQEQASFLLQRFKGGVCQINTFVNIRCLTPEETLVSRTLYAQIETRLKILAEKSWEGPNITGDNRPVIEEE